MIKINKFLKGIGIIFITIILIAALFLTILILGDILVKYYGDSSQNYKTIGTNDIIIYMVYIVQLVVTAILSFMVYKLSKSNEERNIYSENLDKKNAVKYIKSEIIYNKSMISVLKKKNVDLNKVNKYLFKTEAWNKYNIVLLDLLDINDYYLVLSYYSTIQLYGIKELNDDVIETINNTDNIFKIFEDTISHIS